MSRRVVITGLGAVTPVGLNANSSWQALLEGQSGVGPITRFDPSVFSTRIAAEVKGFEPGEWIEYRDLKKFDRFAAYALAASRMAVEDAGLHVNKMNAARVGTVIGSGMGGLETIEATYRRFFIANKPKAKPFTIPQIIPNMAAGQVSIYLGLKGPNLCTATACAAGAHAIGDAMRLIQRGDADAMVAGGSEAVITLMGISGFGSMRALSTRNEEPERACRPFDLHRDGFVMGEGAGVVVLESLDHAHRRGARIRAELCGFGLSGDAYHITSQPVDADGAIRCIGMALEDARIAPEEVGYINAHGTATRGNDRLETIAIKTIFGAHGRRLAVSSTKSMTGHLLGGAGGAEAVFSVLALETGMIPPTINLETPDPECDLDYVPNRAREAQVEVVLSNSFGFGGTNACLVFRRAEPE